jgi:hypothetical protein
MVMGVVGARGDRRVAVPRDGGGDDRLRPPGSTRATRRSRVPEARNENSGPVPEDGAAVLSQPDVHPKGFEPLTF